ncbi:MAG: TonB family protein, partial [Nitrospira sp.]|nr:TonB family protein [Nitrospira sp.]
MGNVLVTHSWPSEQAVKGWGTSLALHACILLAAFVLMPKMTLLVEQEPFKWEVALVEAPHETAPPEEPAPTPPVQPPAPVKPQRQPVRAVQPPPQPVQRPVETRVSSQPVQREVQPVVETVRPQQQIQPPQEVVQVQAKPVEPQEIQKIQPPVQTAASAEVKRETAPAVNQTVIEPMPVAAQTYQAQPVVSAPPPVETRSDPVVTASAPIAQPTAVVEPVSSSSAPAPVMEPVSEPVAAFPAPAEPAVEPHAPVAAAQPDPATMQEHQVVASAVKPKPATKADYGWLAESLHRRIIELRHYPGTARLNGWEGKVVLKVSIRQDGHLKDVEVVKSSGHESLDQAAIEAVRRACPLHMKHELRAPMVVLHLPVSYSLN